MAVGQEAVIADALEAGRQGVLQEAADELLGGDGHHLGVAGVAVIFPLEGDLAIFEGQQTLVGDGHAVGVAAEILQHVVRSAEGGFGVNHPFLVFEGSQVAGKSARVAQRFEVAEELEFAVGMRFRQSFQQQTAEARGRGP